MGTTLELFYLFDIFYTRYADWIMLEFMITYKYWCHVIVIKKNNYYYANIVTNLIPLNFYNYTE